MVDNHLVADRVLIVVRLAFVGLAITTVAACSGEAPLPVATLDPAAAEACETFSAIGGEVRRGELEGQPLYRELQQIYDTARPSGNEAVATAAQRLLTAAINGDRAKTTAAVTELQQACALPFS